MTKEEEKEFKEKIVETIMPIAINMTENQIRTIIQNVEKTNEHDLLYLFLIVNVET